MKVELVSLVAVFGCLYVVDAMPGIAAPGGDRVKRTVEDQLQKLIGKEEELIDLNEKSLAELKKMENQIHMINMKNTNIVRTIRLTGGNSTFGRVEVNVNGEWGSVCDDGMESGGPFDPEGFSAALVICTELGFLGGEGDSVSYEPFTSLQVPNSSLPFHIDNLECKGNERSIFDCRRRSGENCSHSRKEDFAVDCYKSYDELGRTTH